MELDPDLVKVVVVDANAVIVNAGNLVSMLPAKIRQKALVGEVKLVTMQQVVDEVKDKKAREALTSMSGAVDLELREPTDEAREAVRRFAGMTGDVHVLSKVDLDLIALAYDLEREIVKSVDHLRTVPLPTSNVENTGKKSNLLVKMPGWDPEANHDVEWGSQQEGEAAGDAGKSKILQAEIRLDEEGGSGGQDVEAEVAEKEGAPGGGVGEAAPTPMEGGGGNGSEEVANDDDDDDGGWETARRSKNAQRKQKRKMFKKLARRQEEEEEERAGLTATEMETEASLPSESVGDEDGASEGVRQAAAATATASGKEDAAVSSPVVSLTGDFAMQNVLLQMGLQVAGPRDGMVIKEARKFGIRCHACGWSTERPETLSNDIFCPKCGNMNTLDRCQIIVDKKGGVTFVQMKRKNQTLRGLKYSLPQPRTGRNANNPILREDNLKIPKRKQKAQLDAFAPEYNEQT